MLNFKRKSDTSQNNNSLANFIPVVCHYDENTLVTKNGELVQTIEINGINADQISQELVNLRMVVREALKNNIQSNRFAVWLHTIRHKDNLDDTLPYNNLLSQKIHDIWSKKNYWHDKFVNKLYISIVISGSEMRIRSFKGFARSFFPKYIALYEENFLAESAKTLTKVVDNILIDLSSYGADKLGIEYDNSGYYSNPMFLYSRLVKLNTKELPLQDVDISESLGRHQYIVDNDQIIISANGKKKFVAILSIKEYHDVPTEALDMFLHIPVEMITTESFYFIDKKEIAPALKDIDYMLSISGDKDMRQLKGLDKIIDVKETEKNAFCKQQIAITIIADDPQTLALKVNQASKTLSKIGMVHVREDINLEKTFWANLPGNFSFLSRMNPTIFENTGALVSLHNFPSGNKYNPWGRALTILRTDKGTPYFMNFHDMQEKSSNCILGPKVSGKTTIINFLLSESDKYKPTILYITNDMDSGLFIKAKKGKWYQRKVGVINPLLCDDSDSSKEFLRNFFRIISQHHFNPLTKDEMQLLDQLVNSILLLDIEKRKLSDAIISLSTLKAADETKESLMKRLGAFLKDGVYFKVFESTKQRQFSVDPSEIIALNLQNFDDEEYISNFYPKERKLVEQFEYDLNVMRAVKAGIILASAQLLINSAPNPKIFVLDDINQLLNFKLYPSLLGNIIENLEKNKCVFLSSVNLEDLYEANQLNIDQPWFDNISNKIILPPELLSGALKKIVALEANEYKRLSKVSISSRMFLIHQDDKRIISELSIGGYPGITRFLSSSSLEREIYKEIVNKYGHDPDKWIGPFYDSINKV